MLYKIIFAALFIATLVLTLYFGLTTGESSSGSIVPPKWVAVGGVVDPDDFKGLLYSSSGKKWSDSTTGAGFDGGGEGVGYSPEQNRWVAVGMNFGIDDKDKNILHSDDGIHWKPSKEGSCFFDGQGEAVAYGGDRWVAVGSNINSTPLPSSNIMYSSDGIFWQKTTQGSCFGDGGGNGDGREVAYGKDGTGEKLWVAVGSNDVLGGGSPYGNIQYSKYGGVSWEPTFEGASFAHTGNGVAYGNNRWVAVGTNGADKYGNIMWSTTGTCWVATTEGASFSSAGLGVTYNDGLWVAVGDNTTDGGVSRGNILTSTNGKIWSNNTKGDTFSEYGFGVAAKT